MHEPASMNRRSFMAQGARAAPVHPLLLMRACAQRAYCKKRWVNLAFQGKKL
jgi:hypothetical protein